MKISPEQVDVWILVAIALAVLFLFLPPVVFGEDVVSPEVAVAIALVQLSPGDEVTIGESTIVRQVAVWRFTADWCEPCKAMEPAIERLRKLGYVIHDARPSDENWQTVGEKSRAIPFFVLWVGQRIADRRTGILTEQQLREWMDGAKTKTSIQK